MNTSMRNQQQRLTPKTYLTSVGDNTRLSSDIIITPIPWIAERLTGGSAKKRTWAVNGSILRQKQHMGRRIFDVLTCLPGTSMSLITLEEAIAAGAKNITFIGTAASVRGAIPYGEIRMDGNVASVLNPYQEHESWNTIRHTDLVDLELTYVRKLAKKRNIPFRWALIVTDAIWQDKWSTMKTGSPSYKKNLAVSFDKLRQWLDTDD